MFKRKAKYGSIRSGGFQSKLEAAVHGLLRLQEMAGEIKVVRTQVNVHLTKARVLYIPDFLCLDVATGLDFYVEAKGFEGPRWPTIKKLWKHYGPAPLHIWKGSHKYPTLSEIIVPVMSDEAA